MTGDLANPNSKSALSFWRGPVAWTNASDILAVLLALSLPWSASLVGVFAVLFLLSLAATFDFKAFAEILKQPASALPVAMFVLAVLGTFWSTGTPWTARIDGINPAAKLLMIPFLIYHFERSSRGLWVFVVFLASSCLLLVLSFALFVAGISWTHWLGVPVKNYIAQSQEFALCVFGAAGAAIMSWRRHRVALSVLLIALASAFVVNMVFVISSRTILVVIPVLLLVFALRSFGLRGIIATILVASSIFVIAWSASSDFRKRIETVSSEYRSYKDENAVNSTAMRLEFWKKSFKFVEASPFVGHGTGATKTLFERAAIGQTGVSSEVISNPHNQTMNVAVQWGLLGVVVLYAMWLAHIAMFCGAGLAAWVGLVAVVENVVSSLFNSHIFDFTEGWIYVLSVGVAAGILRSASPNAGTAR